MCNDAPASLIRMIIISKRWHAEHNYVTSLYTHPLHPYLRNTGQKVTRLPPNPTMPVRYHLSDNVHPIQLKVWSVVSKWGKVLTTGQLHPWRIHTTLYSSQWPLYTTTASDFLVIFQDKYPIVPVINSKWYSDITVDYLCVASISMSQWVVIDTGHCHWLLRTTMHHAVSVARCGQRRLMCTASLIT